MNADDGRLVDPSPAYAASFVEALREGFRRGTQPAADPAEIAAAARDFAAYLAARHAVRKIELPDGRLIDPVPGSYHWLVLDRTFIGEMSFRHALNDTLRMSGGHIGYGVRPSLQGKGFAKRILALGKDLAKARGIERLLVTCHDDNRASAAVIESQGGVLEDVVDDVFGGGPLRRYWIDLGAA